jgi:rare lipoprotein A
LIKRLVSVAAVAVAFTSVSIVSTFAQCGGASWYGPGFHGRTAASGEVFNQNAMTAAHKSLPFGTRLKVVDQTTGKSVTVTINDRGPYAKGRILDLSKAAAGKLGMEHRGHTNVCISAI